METPTKRDAVIKAQDLTKTVKEKTRNNRKELFENSAIYISILAIVMLIALYAYNTGYLLEYNVPATCMELDLKSYIPLATQIIGVLLWLLYYISYAKTDKILKRNRFLYIRIFYGIVIVMSILSSNHVFYLIGRWTVVVISIIIPIVIELLFLYCSKPARDKVISDVEYHMLVEDYTYNSVLRTYLMGYGLVFIIVAVTIAPLFGSVSAQNKLEYQVCQNMGAQYAVIIDYSDSVLVQKAHEDEKKLIIDTSRYYYYPKDNMPFTYKKYEKVILK